MIKSILAFLLLVCAFCQRPGGRLRRSLRCHSCRQTFYRGRSVTNQIVLIKGDRITEVGPAQEIRITPGSEIVDPSHATILPGLIDAHTHVFRNGPDFETQIMRQSYQYRTLLALANAQKDLMVGFTTLRDLKTLGAMYSDVDLRNAIDRGIVQGPRMQVATRGIQATGGFIMRGFSTDVPVPSALEVVDSPWAARQAVRDQVAHDADLIKVYAAYDFSFLRMAG